MAESTNKVEQFDISSKGHNIEDILLLMRSQSKWESITLLDGQVKLVDLLSAMQDFTRFKAFLDNYIDNVNASVDDDSPLWPGFTPLHLAVMFYEEPTTSNSECFARLFDTDFALIEECLNRGADVTAQDQSARTPLHLAFRHERTSVVEKLLRFHHTSANPVDEANLSHLHIACASGNEGVVKHLLASGADAEIRTRSQFTFHRSIIRKTYDREDRASELEEVRVHAGSTPLHIAVAGNHCEVARVLVDSGANVNVTDDNGVTPIHRLLVLDYYEMAEMLLSADLTPVTVSDAQITHLHVASYFAHVDAVKRLLDLGEDIDARLGHQSALDDFGDRYGNDGHEPTDYRGYGNFTALEITISEFSLEVFEVLIARGADVLSENPDGECPLYTMLSHNDRCSLYLTALAEVMRENDVLARRVEEEFGLTALHIECSDPTHIRSVRQLMDAQMNVNARLTQKALDWAGSTPLHMIANFLTYDQDLFEQESVVLEVIKMLLAAGADISLYNARKQTPLHVWLPEFTVSIDRTGEEKEMMDLMLTSTRDFAVNPRNKTGWSHFLVACFHNNETVIKKFLERGVDADSRIISSFRGAVKNGSSALHLIARNTAQGERPLKVETIDALLRHGVDVNAQDAVGDTVLHRMARNAPDRLDIFESLLGAGADLTALNDLGESPLSALLSSVHVTPAVIAWFIERGCPIHEFNITGQGILTRPLCLANSSLSGRTRIFESLFKSPDIARSGPTGRTAIHSIVSVAGSDLWMRVSIKEYSELITRLTSAGCDIDAEDDSGKTALHLAAQFKNAKAIAALLKNGADVNVVDRFQNTAFSYGSGPCECKASQKRHRHKNVINLFFVHLRKMNHCRLQIHDLNRNLMVNVQPGIGDNEIEKFNEELDQISALKFEKEPLNLLNLLCETGLVAEYPFKSFIKLSLEKLFKNLNVNLPGYTELIGLLRMQVIKARKRIELIDPAADSLCRAASFAFPEICCRAILKCLSNVDLRNLIEAMND